MNQQTHQHRVRASSFGRAASDYDRYRPRYPGRVVDIIASLADGGAVIDVGAGTGILTRQLRDQGLDVVAVEPDEAMAAVARGHGLAVEPHTFETWEPRGRRPMVIVFANSWHWIGTAAALPKVRATLASGGYLVLTWHALTPAGMVADRIDRVYRDLDLPDAQPAPAVPHTSDLTAAGLSVTTDTRQVENTWATEAWLNQQFTISTHLVLDPGHAGRLRRALVTAVDSDLLTVVEHTHTVVAQS